MIERICAFSKKKMDRKLLFRIVKTPNNSIVIDLDYKTLGRGAYLSKSKDVILNAMQKKTLNKALRTNVDDEIYLSLLQYLEGESHGKI